MKREVCPHCGQLLPVMTRHRLNRPMVDALIKLYKAGKPERLAVLGLTHNQHANFQKLQYWGLVRNVSGCRWEILPAGEDFLLNRIAIYDGVVTLKGVPKKYVGERKFIGDITGFRFLQREDYIYA